MNKYQKGFTFIAIALIVLVLAGVGGIGYYLMKKQSLKQPACNAEVKLCPDGSSVGRIGPNCEFTNCSEERVDENKLEGSTFKNKLNVKVGLNSPMGWWIDKETEKNYISKIESAEIKDYNFFEDNNLFVNFLESIFIDSNNPEVSGNSISIAMGKFDWIDRDKNVIVASLTTPENDTHDIYYKFIIIMDDKLNVNIIGSGYSCSPKLRIGFGATPIKILNNYPVFFYGFYGGVGGTCSGAGLSDYIYHIENLNLVENGNITREAIREDKIPKGYAYETDCPYRSEISGDYKYFDKDNDGENEIIASYIKKPLEGSEEIRNKFTESYEEIYKWNATTKTFNIVEDIN